MASLLSMLHRFLVALKTLGTIATQNFKTARVGELARGAQGARELDYVLLGDY